MEYPKNHAKYMGMIEKGLKDILVAEEMNDAHKIARDLLKYDKSEDGMMNKESENENSMPYKEGSLKDRLEKRMKK